MTYGIGELEVIIITLQKSKLSSLYPSSKKKLAKIAKHYKKINLDRFIREIIKFGFNPQSDSLEHPSMADVVIDNHLTGLINLIVDSCETIDEGNRFVLDDELIGLAVGAMVLVTAVGAMVAATVEQDKGSRDGVVLTKSAEKNYVGIGEDKDTTSNGILSLQATRVKDTVKSGGKSIYYNTTKLVLKVQTGTPKQGTLLTFNDSTSARAFTEIPFETKYEPGATAHSDAVAIIELPLFVTKVKFGTIK
jgi:hypothetical protein